MTAAVLQPCKRFVEHVEPSTAHIADALGSFETDERSDVTEPAQLAGDGVCNELAVRKDLEVAIGMVTEELQQLGMKERLTAEDAEVAVSVLLRVADDAVQILQGEPL